MVLSSKSNASNTMTSSCVFPKKDVFYGTVLLGSSKGSLAVQKWKETEIAFVLLTRIGVMLALVNICFTSLYLS